MTEAEIRDELDMIEKRMFGAAVIMAYAFNTSVEESAGLPYNNTANSDAFQETRTLFNDLSDRKDVLEEALSVMA